MKRFFSSAAVLLLLSGLLVSAFAQSPDREKEDHLLTFLEGTYDAVGKYPRDGAVYCGWVTLKRDHQKLLVTRVISGKRTTGAARILAVTADNIPVLQAEYSENGRRLRTTYMIHSDLDNYGRLTGQTHEVGRETEPAGLEALFIRREAE